MRSYLSWLPIDRGTKQILLPRAVHVAMSPKSEKAHYAAYFAMKHPNCNTRLAKKLNDKWMPGELVAKWADFANACYNHIVKPAARKVLVRPGPKPRVSKELAIKIGTVYTQRMLWEHGVSRHNHDMHEVCCVCLPHVRALVPPPPYALPAPSPNPQPHGQCCCRLAGCTPSSKHYAARTA